MTAPGHDHGASPASDGAAVGMRGGLVEFATRRRVTIAMCTVTLLLFGLIALGNLKVNLLPDLSYPTLTVRTEYTGSAPTEIETLITQPVEEAVGVVKNLRKLKSVSRTGQSDVVLEFAWGTNMDQASLEVRDKMEALNLPLEAKAPVLLRFNPSTEPIMRLVLSNKVAPTSDADAVRELTGLRRYADEDLKKKLEPVTGVAAVKVGGGLEDEIQVDIDQQKLAQLNLPIDTVIKRLKDENINISGGRLEEGSQRFLVRTVNQFADLEEIRNLLVTTQAANGSAADSALQQMFNIAASTGSAAAIAAASAAQSASSGAGSSVVANGVPVRLKDVATVRQGYKEREAVIRLGGKESVELAIYKEGDANTVSTAEALRKRLEQIKGTFPSDVEMTTIEDQSRFIEHAIADVKKDAVIGGLLAILIIFLFLRDGWSTFVISLSLPVSIIATFFFMGQLGLSLNVMSLGGLALATGLVVDDSIVVLESIAKARERGLGILQAAIVGTREVSMAVVASTLTTIAVFLPLVFVDGIAGQLFRDQALTVAIAIAISLLVSMTLIPMLSSLKGRPPLAFPEEAPNEPWQPQSRWQKPVALGRRGAVATARWGFYALAWLIVRLWRGVVAVVGPVMRKASDLAMKPYASAERGYLRLLPSALAHPGKVLGVATIIFVATMALVPMLGADLIPQLAQDRFEMTVKLPAGTPLKQTDALVRELQLAHGKGEGVASLYGVSGSGTRLDASPTESGENIGKLTVVMEGGGNARTEAEITERLRDTMGQHPGAQVDFARPALFSFSTPLEIELRGQDMATLEVAGQRLAAMLRGNAHYADVKSTVEEGFPEIQIRFDQERAGALGLTTRQIADVVVKKVRGDVATRYSFRDRKIDVLVRAQEGDRASVESIRRLIVNPGSTRPVTLDAVADVVATTGPSEIHRADQTRVAVVSANLRDIDLGAAMREVQQMVAEQPLGAGVGLHIGGQGEELAQAAKSLIFAFGLAIFLVYLVMASQFESLLHPFVILFTIPLALVGAILALMLTGKPISVVVFIGLILLVGLVTKNAIILIDKVNQLREAGVAKHEALVEGARSRLRPIIMTTLCTLFGFLPLAVAMGEGAEVRAPMAITVIGGLLVSTLLTLLVIPVVYDLMDRRGDAYYRERGRKHAGEIEPGAAGSTAGAEEPA
ncbi:TPA: efflux RND transporter permease subunit [Stenotrophomonas maltophilia]|uniref:Efflux RND transporter permease subunit n=1 Tax=Stenotrophomonas maltophilia TaxID=40324 RepID=A0AAI9G180_STEMA|nr:efflux RND transporter permease subunit [Stenotrophomonas maltophilia]EKT4443312.1 efflux RND transporter permease subunit [Stenotrophomonas maltophilia]MBN5015094.1 efflux RND transporter permease subunit [Stenotrophomonas maltophilia]HDS1306945.1 efflux RND transporter permease subunit [Stenotrophomonas maltophilia]HDS1824455.1 efflux RND transporter permease subunit [Stenotrophomonas maltophilia]HDX0924331.1 efflux RND transporter permease subunit [Stenotrophomonas maltophilia]